MNTVHSTGAFVHRHTRVFDRCDICDMVQKKRFILDAAMFELDVLDCGWQTAPGLMDCVPVPLGSLSLPRQADWLLFIRINREI